MSMFRRSFLTRASIFSLAAVLPAVSAVSTERVVHAGSPSIKRILVYGDSNSFGYGYGAEKGVYRLPIQEVWPQVMASALGSGYEVVVNALSGRTVCRDQVDGSGTGAALKAADFNGMKSLAPTFSENFPIDLVIVMLGTNDANSLHKAAAKQIAEDLAEMTRTIQGAKWQSRTPYPPPQILLIAPPFQPDETAYGNAFKGAAAVTSELPELPRQQAVGLGVNYLNAQDFIKGIPGQEDRVHLDVKQHRQLGEGAAAKVKEIFAR